MAPLKSPPGREATGDLTARLEREAHFHNQKYSGEDLYPRHYSVNPTMYVYGELRNMLGDLSGKRVLEYGCGEGWITRDLVSMGALVDAFDVSEQSIQNTQKHLAGSGLPSTWRLRVMSAESLDYDDDSIDVAVGFAILHHLEFKTALSELHRVLKPGGFAYFAEPLASNPLISAYRKMTPQYRTPDEQPLRLDELPELLYQFGRFEHREFYLTALAAVGLAYLPGGRLLFPRVSSVLHRLDAATLRYAPTLGRFAWYTILCIQK